MYQRIEFDSDDNISKIYNYMQDAKYELWINSKYVTGFRTEAELMDFISTTKLDKYMILCNNRIYLKFDSENPL